MAKRQQVGDFNPYKALQPSQQVTDQYITPSYFQAPQNEMIDIARSLSSLSESLSGVMQSMVQADTEEQRAKAFTDTETMSEDQLRATIAGNWRKAGLSEGGDPITIIALKENAARRLTRDALRSWESENLSRLSQAGVDEDPRAAMQQAFEELGISGFYATNAATAEFSNRSNAFVERVMQVRNANNTKQNTEDYVDNIYNLLTNRPRNIDIDMAGTGIEVSVPVTPTRIKEWVGSIKDEVEKYHALTGKSGREGLWSAAAMAARRIAEDEGEVAAINFLSEVGEISIGGQRMDYSFAAEEDALLEEVQRIAEASESQAAAREERKYRERNRSIKETAGKIMAGRFAEDTDDFDATSPESIQEIQLQLIENGMDPSEAQAASVEVAREIRSIQNARGNQDDPEAVAAVTNMISGNASLETITTTVEALRDSGSLSPVTASKFLANARRDRDVVVRMRTVGSEDTSYGSRRRSVEDAFANLRDPKLEGDLLQEYDARYAKLVRRIVEDPDNAGKDETALAELVSDEATKLANEYFDLANKIEEAPKTIETGPETPEAQRKAVEEIRRQDMEQRERPSDLDPRTRSSWEWDSTFTNYQETYLNYLESSEDPTATEEQVAKAKSTTNRHRLRMMRLAREVAASVPDLSSDKKVNDYWRAKALVGLSLQEITNKKLEGDVELTEKQIDPKFVILFNDVQNIQEFESMVENDDPRLVEVYEALPQMQQVGFGPFLKKQAFLIRRYR